MLNEKHEVSTTPQYHTLWAVQWVPAEHIGSHHGDRMFAFQSADYGH